MTSCIGMSTCPVLVPELRSGQQLSDAQLSMKLLHSSHLVPGLAQRWLWGLRP